MNESVVLVGGPELIRNSLILTGLTFPHLFRRCLGLLHAATAPKIRKGRLAYQVAVEGYRPEVTLNVALTLAPGATGSVKLFDVSLVP